MVIIEKAPAKINLGLDIVGKRPDGYHDLSMLMVSVDLNDLSVESLKSFYTYNYYEDFSVEYKKLDRPSYIVGWYVIDEAKYKEKVKEKTKSETSKNEDASSDEETEINLEEIYNTKDTSKLSKLNEIELKILQNYPFAKDGYIFETPELKEYFVKLFTDGKNIKFSNESYFLASFNSL